MDFLKSHSFWITAGVCAILSFSIGHIVTSFFVYFIGLDRSLPEFNAISVLIGSVSTAITFAFLIFQNIKISTQQKKFEGNQKKLWAAQQVQIQFEMYQAHKREFFSVLNDIKNDSLLEIEFHNQEDLYRRIFPMNSFKSVSLNIVVGHTDDSKPRDFTDINETYLSVVETLKKLTDGIPNVAERRDAPYKLLRSLLLLSSRLNLVIKPQGRFGDVTFNDSVLLNAYKLNDTINIFYSVLNRIVAFVSNTHIDEVAHLSSFHYNDAMQKVLFVKGCRVQSTYDLTLDKDGYAIGLYNLYYFFYDLDIRRVNKNLGYLQLVELMSNPEKSKKIISNNDDLFILINTIIVEYEEFIEDISENKSLEFEHIMSTFSKVIDYGNEHLCHKYSTKV